MQSKEVEFKQILEKNKDRIFRICCYHEKDETIRQDLYQEVLINIWNALRRFRNESKLSTYIYRIAVNTALKFKLTEAKNNWKLNSIEKIHKVTFQYHDINNEQESKIKLLMEAIYQLKQPERTIISLLLEDFSYQDIADVTGLTKNNVGVKITRAKEKLRKILEGYKNEF
jgi:RNA polymerase sigma factor (sigma-70 family)